MKRVLPAVGCGLVAAPFFALIGYVIFRAFFTDEGMEWAMRGAFVVAVTGLWLVSFSVFLEDVK